MTDRLLDSNAISAVMHTVILVTRDGHFKPIIGLQVQDWSSPASAPSSGLEP